MTKTAYLMSIKMKPLLKLFVAICLVSFVLSRPIPEGDTTDEGEGLQEDTPEENGDEDQPNDASEADSAGEETESGDAGGEDTEGEDEESGGENSEEGKTDGDDAGQQDEENKEDESGDVKEDSPASGGDTGKGKDDRVNTYNKVIELLDKDTKVDQIESTYLRPALDNDIQTELRIPVIDVISTIGDFNKISSCFKSMGSDVKKIIDKETKSFKACMSKKDSSEYQCSEESSNKAKGQFTEIGSKIKSCVSSKGN